MRAMGAPAIQIEALRERDVPRLILLARDIWYRHYTCIITAEQIEYMLAQRYRSETIKEHIRTGQVWWYKLVIDGQLAGFAASQPGDAPHKIKLDQLYVRYDLRGLGLGSMLIAHIERRSRAMGCNRLDLQVNKNNRSAIQTYLRNGFRVAGAATFDIGAGFVMDDFLMAKTLAGHEE